MRGLSGGGVKGGKRERIAQIAAAIESGEVDALVVSTPAGQRVYTANGENPHRALVEAMREGALTVGVDGMIRYANQAFAGMTGYGLEKVMGSDLRGFIEGRDRGKLAELLKCGERGPQRGELGLEARGGRRVPVQVSIQPLPGAPGGGLCVVVTDLTEVEASQQSQRRLAAIVETSGDAIFSLKLDGKVESWNGGAEQMLGRGAGEVLGTDVGKIFVERSRGELERLMKRIERGETVMGVEMTARGRDEGEVEVLLTLSPIQDREGRVVGASAIARDFTERRRAHERLRSVLESAPDAIVVANGEGLVVMVNTQAEKLFGYRRDEMIGRAIAGLVESGMRDVVVEWIGQRLGYGRRGSQREVMARRVDGSSFPAEMSIGLVETEEGELWCATLRDVSERYEYQKTLQERNLQFQEALRAKDRFLAAMSHELKTPLTAIIGFTGVLLMKISGPLVEAQVRQLELIRASARSLLTLITDLLDLARLESGKSELQKGPVEGREVLEEVMRELSAQAEGKGLEMEVGEDCSGVVVETDRRYLRQILANLMSNAVKYTDQGKVVGRVWQERDGGREVVRFGVKDTGIGIGEEDITRLFSEFWRGSGASGQRKEGSGLGLYLSQRLALLLGGRITVQSELGRGSTFTLTLPVRATG